MKISKNFVVSFLIFFLLVILGNIVALVMNFYKDWMFDLLSLGILFAGFLFVRKKFKSENYKVRFIAYSASIVLVLYTLFWIIVVAPQSITFITKLTDLTKQIIALIFLIVLGAVYWLVNLRENKKLAESVKKTIKIILVVLGILAIVGLGIYTVVTHSSHSEKNYFYDIGSQQDVKTVYLYPQNRISDAIGENSNNSLRNIVGSPVYFNVPVSGNAKTIKITLRFADNFPIMSNFSIGARKGENSYSNVILVSHDSSQYGNRTDWTVKSASFNVSDVYVTNQSLSFILSASYLNGEAARVTYRPIPMDWINISVLN